ncbi:MAG: NBR1-Ig-like domain-containing protein [Acidimicrobiales bacterium]
MKFRQTILLLGAALVITTVLAGPAFAARPVGAGGGGAGSSDNSSFAGQTPPPASNACGVTTSVTVSFANTGTTTWTTGTYQLYAVDPSGNTNFGPATQALATSVAPGATASFSWSAQLPSTSGTYEFSWQMENGSTTFGAVSPAVAVEVSCPLSDVFTGAARFVLDPSFTFDQPGVFWAQPDQPNHVDETFVDRGASVSPRYDMFFRTFVTPEGGTSTNGVPTGIGLATSDDGNAWTVYNNGKPVIAERSSTLQTGTACNPTPSQCVVTMYAPSAVVLPDGSLTMAYEVMDTGVSPNTSTPRNWIEAATSVDGINWTPLTDPSGAPLRVLVSDSAWEGFDSTTGNYPGNVGTPSLSYDAVTNSFTLGYHGLSTSATLARGFATGPSLSNLTRYASNPVMTGSPGWMGTGPGKADDTSEGKYTYRVFEAFNGSPSCNQQGTEVGWGLARSTDGIHWSYSSLNPMRTGRIDFSCGEDMPTWQTEAGTTPMVVTTNIGFPLASGPTIHRYKIVEVAQPTTSANVVGLAETVGNYHQNGYWQLDSSGGVTGHGVASYGSASGSGFVSIANGPEDSGYWTLTSSGRVYSYGSAVAHGDLSSLRPRVSNAVSIASTEDQGGYWIALSSGKIYAFGDAVNYGSPSVTPPSPVVMLTPSIDGLGYWLVDQTGDVYAFGDAPDYGGISVSGVIGLTVRSDGQGYWITNNVGNNWTLGSATGWYGSVHGYQPEGHFQVTAVGPYATGPGNSQNDSAGVPDQTNGYFVQEIDGGLVNFGAAPYFGSVKGPNWNA